MTSGSSIWCARRTAVTANLTAGHDTHPVDIERALKGDYSNDAIVIVAAASFRADGNDDGGAGHGRDDPVFRGSDLFPPKRLHPTLKL
jgi:hypothetical protein